MPLIRRRALLTLPLATAAIPARAQDAWPNRPIRITAPFAPGGSADTLGRLVAQELQTALGQSVVVENRPGAGGVLGSLAVARAAPDGYSFVISGIASHVVAPAINSAAGFDPIKDFTHIAFLGGPPTVFIVNNNIPARNLAEFVALARGGQRFAFGSPGAGTHGHLFGIAFMNAGRFEMDHIPYRGAGAAMGDIIGGSVPAGSITLSSAAGAIRGGQVRALALTTATRARAFPDLPTFTEQGFPDLAAMTWFGLSGPAGLPAPIVDRLNREVVRAMALPRIRDRLEADATEAVSMTAAEYTRFIETETARWAPIARAAGVRAE
ncbi:Bug family tripartite tricarboxylate transporter substrate binding protein [Falsiroseomonas stagni]|uniref:Tripartite-type tricarboxylate transporter, receptor component TctC n=1 Tax=Falsiroseomonas stagni DSM 19981 TaxID=1123062 RepID=A0A1I3Y8N0_9PROT|nr:tripartite tricarboxylate transporter substrate-binding protein [Falsiroseomonas stagni]SFK28208.1 Tripartite-type tricarboxylate transporter, receptor component TctC [Falsiroseomonas stagni DSM 19981]